MKDLKRCICKVCSFKSDNLVEHIEKTHFSLAVDAGMDASETLVWYFEKYSVDENEVVFPAEEGDSVAKPVASEIEIAGIKLPMGPGGDYVPRLNTGYHFSEMVKDVCQDIQENKRVLLLGHTGCGKTSMIEQIGARVNRSVLRINMNGQTTIGDFVGMWIVKNGETIWVDGLLPLAVRNGWWLIVDELDMAEPAILAVMNALLEKFGKLTLKEKGHEVIEPHPDFRLFATANGVGCMAKFRGLYQGTNIMNEAFLDRWRCYHVDYLKPEEEELVIANSVPKVTVKIAKVIVRVGNMVREAFRKEEVSCTMSLRRLIDWTELMVRHKDPIKAAGPAIFAKVSDTDKEVIEAIIRRVMLAQTEAK